LALGVAKALDEIRRASAVSNVESASVGGVRGFSSVASCYEGVEGSANRHLVGMSSQWSGPLGDRARSHKDLRSIRREFAARSLPSAFPTSATFSNRQSRIRAFL